MQVFIGNPTLQHREVHYRLPQAKTTRVVRIAAGGQEKLAEDLNGNNLQKVIDQLERLGAVRSKSAHTIIRPKGLVYDVSPNPINVDELQEGLERDENARQEVSADKMHEAGLAAFQNAGKGAIETSVEIVETNDRGIVKNSVDMEVVVSRKASRRAGKLRVENKN